MDKEELIKRLDGRPGAWLGRKLKFARPKQQVNHWTSGRVDIPEKHHEKIRELLPLETDV